MRVLSALFSGRNFSSNLSTFSSSQISTDSLQAGFSTQATNLNFLTAMTAASGAFSLGRVLGTSLFSSVLGGAALRAASWSVGLLAEVATFRRVNQALNPGLEIWSDSRSFAATTADFLLLKGAGVLLGGNPYLVRLGGQATAMVGGEYVGESLRLRESTERSFAERYANALVTGVAMEVGGTLCRLASAGRSQIFHQHLSYRRFSLPLHSELLQREGLPIEMRSRGGESLKEKARAGDPRAIREIMDGYRYEDLSYQWADVLFELKPFWEALPKKQRSPVIQEALRLIDEIAANANQRYHDQQLVNRAGQHGLSNSPGVQAAEGRLRDDGRPKAFFDDDDGDDYF